MRTDPVAVPNNAKATPINSTPVSPTRRGPSRSTMSPIGSAATAAAMPTMVRPSDASARVHPKSDCSGSMNAPSEYTWMTPIE